MKISLHCLKKRKSNLKNQSRLLSLSTLHQNLFISSKSKKTYCADHPFFSLTISMSRLVTEMNTKTILKAKSIFVYQNENHPSFSPNISVARLVTKMNKKTILKTKSNFGHHAIQFINFQLKKNSQFVFGVGG